MRTILSPFCMVGDPSIQNWCHFWAAIHHTQRHAKQTKMKHYLKLHNSLPRRTPVQRHLGPSSYSYQNLQNLAKPTPPATVFSGIQPTGIPHLGNYLGALRQWVGFQNSAPPSTKLIFCIVDLHAITQPQNASDLRRWKKEMLTALLAIGLNPDRCIIFEQSRVPAHSELMWILSCVASTGRLSRMTQWKVGFVLLFPSIILTWGNLRCWGGNILWT